MYIKIQFSFSNIIVLLLLILFIRSGDVQSTTQGNKSISAIDSMKVEAGWNLLSLPMIVTDGLKGSLFPSAASDAFLYQNEYKAEDTLSNGYGFWMKFNSAETFAITGDTIYYDVIEVRTGWNLIGSLTTPVAVNTIRSLPQGIIITDFFNYSSGTGYQSTDTIQPGKGYWIKVSQDGSIALDALTGKPCPAVPTVDYAGKIYNTVQIRTQCWLKENLNVGGMINGTAISTDNGTIEKYCYNDLPSNCDTYGGFYQWDEAMEYSFTTGTKGICPPGWHIPKYSDIESLTVAANYDGNALKAVGQGSEGGAGTNTSGFSALLSGARYTTGEFSDLGTGAFFWTSIGGVGYGYNLSLWYSDNSIYLNSIVSDYGYNVRCVMDMPNRPPDEPANPIPDDQTTGLPTNIALLWTCSDPDGDPINYDIYFGTDNPPETVVSSNNDYSYWFIGRLNEGTSYFWRVIAKDDHGNSRTGPVWKFITGVWGTECDGIPVVEHGSKTYHTVQIGNQCWLKENLDIGLILDGALEQTNNSIIEKYCYNNDTTYCNIYGALYQWDEIMQYNTTEGTQGICPVGWHIPAFSEFDTLIATVSNDGNTLKALGQGIGDGAGTNISGFSALLTGYRHTIGNFFNLDEYTYFWSSTQTNSTNAYDINLFSDKGEISWYGNPKGLGFSVRCLKD